MLRLALALLLLPALALGQNTVPTVSFGPTASAFSVRFGRHADGSLDSKFGMLAEGLGMSVNVNNLVGSPDGSMSWLGVKFPIYPRIESSEFALGLGAELSFFNSLLGIGAAVDFVDTATDRGVILGEVDAEDVMVTVSLGFNLGSGGTPATASKALAASKRPPFNFVPLTR